MSRRSRIAPGLTGLLALGVLSAPAAAVDVFNFDGSITDVGIQRGPGQVGGVEFRIRGNFLLDQPLDLSRATVTLEEIFVDDADGGLGELMTTTDDAPVAPLVLRTRAGDADNNVFDSPLRYRPVVRLQVQKRIGAYQFRLKLDRGLMRNRPRACEENLDASALPMTPMTHGLLIDDGVNPSVEIRTTQLWECTKPGRYHMRSRPSGHEAPPPTPVPTSGSPTPIPTPTPPPAPGNKPPKAALKQNVRVGEDGLRDLIELDGRDSSDDDGTVVRYRFDSGDGRVQDGPEPLAYFVYPIGKYRASLQVFDDRGTPSEIVTRGLSVMPPAP